VNIVDLVCLVYNYRSSRAPAIDQGPSSFYFSSQRVGMNHDHIVEWCGSPGFPLESIKPCRSVSSMTYCKPEAATVATKLTSPSDPANTRGSFAPTTRSTDRQLCLTYTNINDMDQLPLELYEHIFSYLLSQKHREQLVALPVSTKSERTDVYNLRLTSRRVCMGASHLLSDILQDVPTQCKEDSLIKLAALVEIPTVSRTLTCLTLKSEGFSHQWNSDSLADDFSDINRQLAWVQENLHSGLAAIIQKASRIRHIIYVLEEDRWAKVLRRRMRYKLWRGQEPIPFHVRPCKS
jgi:hypothetical protein